MLPTRAVAVACLLVAAAPLAGAADREALAWADVRSDALPVAVDASVAEDYQVFVDGAIRAAGRSAAPPTSADGAPAVETDGATDALPHAPTAIVADTHAPASVLADGWTLPADFPLRDLRVGAGVASDEPLLDLTAPKAKPEPSSSSSSSASSGAAPSGGASGLAAPAPATSPKRVVAEPVAGEAYTLKPVTKDESRAYTPSAVALAPAPSSNAGTVAAASAVAIGALLALWPLYHRLRGAETLESATRKRIYDIVCARAGAGVAEAALKGGVSYSTATYHLDRLVEAGMIVASSEGAKLRYYKNGGFNEADRKLVPLLENAEVMRILGLIRENPGTYRAALADALNVTTTTINWHLKRLTQAGLVREERKGRSAHLYAVEERLSMLPALGARLAVTTDEGAAAN